MLAPHAPNPVNTWEPLSRDGESSCLTVERLAVALNGRHTPSTDILRGVSFQLRPGRTLVLLGESGSGKSVTARAILGLLDAKMTVSGGVRLQQMELSYLSAKDRNRIRGDRIAFIPQDPSGALSPFAKVSDQIVEVLRTHRKDMTRAQARVRAIELLRMVRIADPERVAGAWPHELSGGMRQRVAIAIALSCDPEVLIADEPTTALDVTVQAQVIELFKGLLANLDSSLLLITHDVGVAREMGDDVAVMYAGRIVEMGPGAEVLERPHHPYTRALLGAVPSASVSRGSLTPIPGQPPQPGSLSGGCAFAARCAHATPDCTLNEPELISVSGSVTAACTNLASVGHD